MYKYTCLNNISEKGISGFTAAYEKTENIAEAQGILVRTCASFGLGNSFLRLAVRTETENGRLINALEGWLDAR